MSPHRAVIEAGPGAIRRLCCGADVVADTAVSAAALAAIDDQVALLDERPVAVDSLWFDALRSVAVDHRDGPVVVHPSWWSAARVEVVTAAARTLTRDVVVHPRSWLLRQASSGVSAATVVVEIAERLVLVAGAEVAAVARRTDAESVARPGRQCHCADDAGYYRGGADRRAQYGRRGGSARGGNRRCGAGYR